MKILKINDVEVDDITYLTALNSGKYKVDYTNDTEINIIPDEEAKKDILRKRREPLLTAFDIYKSNVGYGVVEETSSTHEEVTTWYNKILALEEDAIDNVPDVIKKYL